MLSRTSRDWHEPGSAFQLNIYFTEVSYAQFLDVFNVVIELIIVTVIAKPSSIVLEYLQIKHFNLFFEAEKR